EPAAGRGDHRRLCPAAELQARDWRGSARTGCPHRRAVPPLPPAPPPAPAVPKPRQITRWLLPRPAALDAGEQAQLTAILARCPHPGALAGHNLAEYAEKTVAAHRGCPRETAHVRAF